MSLKGVGHELSALLEGVSPGVGFAIEAAALGILVLGFGGQPPPFPLAIGVGVLIGDVDDRVLFFAFEVTVRSLRVAPVGTFHVVPPLKVVVEWNRVIGWREDNGTRDQIFGRCPWKILGAGCFFRQGHIARRFREAGELQVSDFGLVDPEPVEIDAVPRASVAEHRLIGAHPEFARWYPTHPGRRCAWSAYVVRTKGRIDQGDEGFVFLS